SELLESRDFGNHHRVGVRERGDEFVLKYVPSRRVTAWLEHRPEFLLRILDAQSAERLADRRGMMAEVVDHRDAAGDAAHFHPALDAFEGIEGGLDLMILQAAMLGAGDDGERIADVQFADKVQMKLETRDLKLG